MSINCDEALLKTLHIKVADIALKIVLEIIVHRQPADRREEILRLLEKTMTASEYTLFRDRNVIPDISLVRNRKTLAVIETKRCAFSFSFIFSSGINITHTRTESKLPSSPLTCTFTTLKSIRYCSQRTKIIP